MTLHGALSLLQTVRVTTACPFCGGTTLLMDERDVRPRRDEIEARFAGRRMLCENPECERTYVIRRGDLKVARK